MKFVSAHHKQDYDGTDQTIGVDPLGQIWLSVGNPERSESGRTFAQFAPREAIRFAYSIIALALQGVRIQENRDLIIGGNDIVDELPGYERFPLRTDWGYNRYQDLAAVMSPKQAMAQASLEESSVFPCSKCKLALRLFDDGIWESAEDSTCQHEPQIGNDDDSL